MEIYFFSDHNNNVIRKIASTGIITTIAGTGVAGFSGDGGAAVSATLNQPYGVALDDLGNLYFVDCLNQRIRKIDTAGIITTIAGTGTAGFNGDGIAATSAEINGSAYVSVDRNRNVYISDGVNLRIRKIDTMGTISTYAGSGYSGYTGDGGAATLATIGWPGGVSTDTFGNLYFCDFGNNCIRKVNASGIMSTIAGNGTEGYAGDGGPAASALLNQPEALNVDDSGNIFIADSHNNVIRKIEKSSGIITTIAGNGVQGYGGDGALATDGELNTPDGVCVVVLGNVYVADAFNYRVRKITYNTDAASNVVQVSLTSDKFTISPNPATTLLAISSANEINQVAITNVFGQIVYVNSCNVQYIQINIADLSPGVYFIKINNGVVKKFIKQ